MPTKNYKPSRSTRLANLQLRPGHIISAEEFNGYIRTLATQLNALDQYLARLYQFSGGELPPEIYDFSHDENPFKLSGVESNTLSGAINELAKSIENASMQFSLSVYLDETNTIQEQVGDTIYRKHDSNILYVFTPPNAINMVNVEILNQQHERIWIAGMQNQLWEHNCYAYVIQPGILPEDEAYIHIRFHTEHGTTDSIRYYLNNEDNVKEQVGMEQAYQVINLNLKFKALRKELLSELEYYPRLKDGKIDIDVIPDIDCGNW